MERLRHLVETQDLTPEIVQEILKRAERFRAMPQFSLKGKIIVTAFYEPSTRTRLSFESAMMRLGGRVISTENARDFSSAAKGETIEDTVLTLGCYGDAIVIRHYEEGSLARAAAVSPVPVINAGDGPGQHPTQGLLDYYTLVRECGDIDGLEIVMAGDLKNARTARSLCYLFGKVEKKPNLTFVSSPSLKMRDDIKAYLEKKGISFREEDKFKEVLARADAVYMLRNQAERQSADENARLAAEVSEFEQQHGEMSINEETLLSLRGHARVLHPLPHGKEIKLPYDIIKTDPRIAIFREVENGLYSRMGLLDLMLAA